MLYKGKIKNIQTIYPKANHNQENPRCGKNGQTDTIILTDSDTQFKTKLSTYLLMLYKGQYWYRALADTDTPFLWRWYNWYNKISEQPGTGGWFFFYQACGLKFSCDVQ